MRYDSILGTIGATPVVRLRHFAPPGINLYAKLEAFNPMGSVKDRLALGVIEDAERSGRLKPGQTVVEATSGNTGIGLAMVCAARGYPLVVTMAENFSVERRKLMRFLGAKVVLTPAAQKGSGMLAKAAELAAAHGWFFVRQFENEANADVHSRTTAPEILADFADEPLAAWVTGFGSGGTLKGVARVLRERSPSTRIVVCEPENSPMLGSGLEQPRAADGSPLGSHPAFRPHAVQGWAPDFIPKLTEDSIAQGLIDEVVPINGFEALRLARELATREGILAGISGGATLAGALAVARRLPAGANVLCMLPDTGERYLSTPLFGDVSADMTDEELEISCSTPGARFDRPAPAPTPAPSPQPVAAAVVATQPTADAEAFVAQTIGEPSQPVVLFALEWCEFCWSLRRLFDKLGVRYRSVDLDSVAYQSDRWGERVRAALTARTGVATIPQVFVGGHFMGGATDVIDAWGKGTLQRELDSAGVGFVRDAVADARSFLPGWLQPR
ncbi:MAG TPA: pyridoxal-phosphate dependent enzyme [Steroidobacteraceae bacterium]|nr:pyridoxal-phosphate dependent enzyme [Steroidobacteraceae bacterium]